MNCKEIVQLVIGEWENCDIEVEIVEGGNTPVYEDWCKTVNLPDLEATDLEALWVAVHETMHAIRHQVWLAEIYGSDCIDEDALNEEEWIVETMALNFLGRRGIVSSLELDGLMEWVFCHEGHDDLGRSFEEFRHDVFNPTYVA